MPSPGGRIVNIQNFSLHDGPGIRTTVFFKGCPLQCIWCANPEMQKRKRELMHNRSRCIGCGECIQACPDRLISSNGLSAEQGAESLHFARENCTLCGTCVAVCPSGAMQIAGFDASTAHVLAEVEKEKHFFRHSGGGVTLSGGEPLNQPDFAEAILTACRRWGIHTAMETCGHAPYDTIEKIAALIDVLYFDLKLADTAAHNRYTRVNNRWILENLARISTRHPQLVVRTPVIPGINNHPEALNAIGRFLVGRTAVSRVEFLNYHSLGEHKYTNLGREYSLAELKPLDRETFADLCGAFSERFPTLNFSYHA